MVTSTADATLIRDALTDHYVRHGLPPDGGASSSWFNVHIGSFVLRLPNPPARRRAVVMHDINHIVTGYNTTFSEGEMAIAAFATSVEPRFTDGVLFVIWAIVAVVVFIAPLALLLAGLRLLIGLIAR
jgi:hypothetical protein